MARFEYDEGVAPEHREGAGTIMPEGDYVGQVIESDITDNNNQNGKILKLTWELLNDGFRGRRVWQNINVLHTGSAEAQRIGQIEFANLKDVIGLGGQTVRDTTILHNKPAGLRLKIETGRARPNGGVYPDRNQVAAFFKAEDFAPAGHAPAPASAPAQAPAPRPAPAQAPAAPAPAPAPAANGTPPWMKKAA